MPYSCEPSRASRKARVALGGRRRTWRHRGYAGLSATVVVVFTLGVFRAPQVSASTPAQIQSEISSLQAQLVNAGASVHQATLAYDTAVASERSLAAQVANDKVLADRAEASLSTSEAALRVELVSAYVGGYMTSPVSPAHPGGVGVADPAVAEGYISVATDTLRGVVERFRTARLEWASAQATVTAREKASQQSAAVAEVARAAAVREATVVGGQIQGLQAQLTALESQAGTRAGASTPQGGPVGGGLLQAVQAQLNLASATAGSAAASASASASASSGGRSSPVTGSASGTTTRATAPPTAPVEVSTPAATAPATTAPATTAPATTAPATTAPANQSTNTPATSVSGTVQPASTTGPGSAGATPNAADWLELRTCESSDNYQENTGNGYFGAYQFSQATWSGLGYPGRPDQEPPSMQDQAAATLQAESGWGAWPSCSAALGL